LSFGCETSTERIGKQLNFLFWQDIIFARLSVQIEWPKEKSKFEIYSFTFLLFYFFLLK